MGMWCKFRVIALLRPGVLTVRPVPPHPSSGQIVLLDVFVDEVPLELVSSSLRMPNAEFWGLVQSGRNVVEVKAAVDEDLQWTEL